MAHESRVTVAPAEADAREPLRVYAFHCGCGCPFFTAEWAMFSDLDGRARLYCADCKREAIPTEPKEYNA